MIFFLQKLQEADMHNTTAPTTATLPILLKALGLGTIVDSLQIFLEKAENEGWSYTKLLSMLCEQELEVRQRKKAEAYLKKAKLPIGKSLATFDFNEIPTLNKAKINDLALDNAWVKRGDNLMIFGPSGVGKSHLAAGIGYALVENNMKVLFMSATKLVQELQAARRDCNLPAELAKLDKYDVIIVDDIGYVRKDEFETHVLFELIAQRYESGSIIITSNQPFSEWDSIFTTNSMTVAAIDRLVHHATILEIQSESYRRKSAISKQIEGGKS
jgi:DNA replication protein DnaC